MKLKMIFLFCISLILSFSYAGLNSSGRQKYVNSQSLDNPIYAEKIVFRTDRYGPAGEICIMNPDGSDLKRLTTNSATDRCPCISPDGKKISFTSNRSGNYEVYIMNTDGSNPQRLTNSPEEEAHTDWYPDGSKIAFSRHYSLTSSNIFVINTDGTNEQQITNEVGHNMAPQWSADGTKILFNSTRDGNHEIYTMNADGSNQQRLLFCSVEKTFPRWSPDGSKITYSALNFVTLKGAIHVMNADGTNDVAITTATAINEGSRWSPDGNQIVFQSDRTGNFEIFQMNSDGNNQIQLTYHSSWDENAMWGKIRVEKIAFYSERGGNADIYLMDTDGGALQRITSHSARDVCPAVSPDGSKIAFLSNRDGNFEIYVMKIDGSNQQRLTQTSNNEQHPAWSPDGTKIYYMKDFGTNTAICVMDSNGDNPLQLTNGLARDVRPCLSPDGCKILFNSDRDGNREIYLMDLDGTNQQRLTNTALWEVFPCWSPDGEKIAYGLFNDITMKSEVHIMNADGSEDTAITNAGGISENPCWSPDGDRIVFQTDRSGNFEVYVMNSNGTNQYRITNNSAWDGWPSWGALKVPDTSEHPVEIDSISIRVRPGWNMLSLPIDSIYLTGDLVPPPISEAYYYIPDSTKYAVEDTLRNGIGYWLKFASEGVLSFFIDSTFIDTISVKVGWNMIGSVSCPVPLERITSDPPGMITSEFFTYQSGYVVSDTILPGTGYWVKVEQPGSLILSASQTISLFKCIKIAPDDERPPSAPFDLLTSDDKTIPGVFVLYQNYPNPFNPSTNIRFDLPVQSHVRLEVFNVVGELVRTLLDEEKDAGSYSITWDGADNTGHGVSTGLYYYRLRSGSLIQVKKGLLIK